MLFFWNFLLPFGKERNKTIVFIISLSQLFPTYFGLERHRNVIFQFLNFFAFFLEFSLALREGTKRSDNFYFLSFSAFSHLFWLGMNPYWYFSIFSLFFWNFLFLGGKKRNVAIIFIFTLSLPFPTNFGLKWSHNGMF